jgi:hypothetical protein
VGLNNLDKIIEFNFFGIFLAARCRLAYTLFVDIVARNYILAYLLLRQQRLFAPFPPKELILDSSLWNPVK